jgi:hypothetical protein
MVTLETPIRDYLLDTILLAEVEEAFESALECEATATYAADALWVGDYVTSYLEGLYTFRTRRPHWKGTAWFV